MQSKKITTFLTLIACSALLAGGCAGPQAKTVQTEETAPASEAVSGVKTAPTLSPEPVTAVARFSAGH